LSDRQQQQQTNKPILSRKTINRQPAAKIEAKPKLSHNLC